MRQLGFTGEPPPTSDVARFLEWVRERLMEIANASGDNVYEPEVLDVYAPLASPAFTGTPTAPTPAPGDNDTSLATTAYVQTELVDYALIASPAFTGTPTAPTPAPGDNDTSLATTEFVTTAIAANPSVAPTQTDFLSGFIPYLADQDYKLVVKAPYAMTITEITTICTSGTATATFKINATALGGTANAVSTTEQSQAHASANAVAAGDDIVLTVSANASCVGFSFTIVFTKTLAQAA